MIDAAAKTGASNANQYEAAALFDNQWPTRVTCKNSEAQ